MQKLLIIKQENIKNINKSGTFDTLLNNFLRTTFINHVSHQLISLVRSQNFTNKDRSSCRADISVYIREIAIVRITSRV